MSLTDKDLLTHLRFWWCLRCWLLLCSHCIRGEESQEQGRSQEFVTGGWAHSLTYSWAVILAHNITRAELCLEGLISHLGGLIEPPHKPMLGYTSLISHTLELPFRVIFSKNLQLLADSANTSQSRRCQITYERLEINRKRKHNYQCCIVTKYLYFVTISWASL